VVGSYGYPGLIEMQIRAIRRYAGDVPILISDDRSPDGGWERIQALACQYPGVDVHVALSRIGHSGGDMAAFARGIMWAKDRGIRYLAKLSHRFVVTRPRWLQEGARALAKTGRPLAGQPCVEHPFQFPLRTEACLLDVDRWHNPDVLAHLAPRPVGMACELIMHHVCTEVIKEEMAPWDLFTKDRFERVPGVLWHCANGIHDYNQLAEKLGVVLDSDFHTGGNHLRSDYITG